MFAKIKNLFTLRISGGCAVCTVQCGGGRNFVSLVVLPSTLPLTNQLADVKRDFHAPQECTIGQFCWSHNLQKFFRSSGTYIYMYYSLAAVLLYTDHPSVSTLPRIVLFGDWQIIWVDLAALNMFLAPLGWMHCYSMNDDTWIITSLLFS